MESIALFRGASPSKLPMHKPSSSIPTMASSLRFDLNTPSFSRLSNGSVGVSIGRTWNPNIHDKFLAHRGISCGGETHYSDAKEDALKSLLSLVQAKEKNSPSSMIIPIKNEALKLVMDEKYLAAECLMKGLCDRNQTNADVAYEARVAYVQILIYLDEYEKARKFLEEKDNFPRSDSSDGRPSLYKAVVHTMLGNGDAEKWWNKYLATLGNGKLKIHSENTNSESFLTDTKGILKSLLSLKPAKVEKGSVLSNIIPTKNKALRDVVNGKYEIAESRMKILCEDLKNNLQENVEAQVAYVQILIYLDKYKEALALIEKQSDLFPESDARPCLYKAIGHTALGRYEDAKTCWEAFIKTIGTGLPNPNEEDHSQ